MQEFNRISKLDYNAQRSFSINARDGVGKLVADSNNKSYTDAGARIEAPPPASSQPAVKSVKKPRQPDWYEIYQALKKPGTTKQRAWLAYTENYPGRNYSYSQFCACYNAWFKDQKRLLQQVHRAGEKLFVTCRGPSLPVLCAMNGQIRSANLLVAVLGASHYLYSEAIWSVAQPDWNPSYARAFQFFGGMPRSIVVDGPLAGSRLIFDRQLIAKYGVKVVEDNTGFWSLKIAERWLAGKLRHQTFFSLAELNASIRSLTTELNYKPFKYWPGSRRQWFEQLDLTALSPLPVAAMSA
jgi:hypothetical protein